LLSEWKIKALGLEGKPNNPVETTKSNQPVSFEEWWFNVKLFSLYALLPRQRAKINFLYPPQEERKWSDNVSYRGPLGQPLLLARLALPHRYFNVPQNTVPRAVLGEQTTFVQQETEPQQESELEV
jgi:hypothetical protein